MPALVYHPDIHVRDQGRHGVVPQAYAVITFQDFSLLKNNFGLGGSPPSGPSNP